VRCVFPAVKVYLFWARAKETAAKYSDVFAGNFFLSRTGQDNSAEIDP
jgi:hypothetical protein